MGVFRNEHRELNPDERLAIRNIKADADQLYEKMLTVGVSDAIEVEVEGAEGKAVHVFVKVDSRMMALARTKLEESVMWATKAITG